MGDKIPAFLDEFGDNLAFRRALLALRRRVGQFAENWTVGLDGQIRGVEGELIARARSEELAAIIVGIHNYFLPVTNMLIATRKRLEDLDDQS